MFLRIWSSIDAHKPLIFEVVSICLGDHIMWIYGETDQSGDIVLAECNCSKHTAFFNSCYRHDPTVFLLVKHECRKRRRIIKSLSADAPNGELTPPPPGSPN